MTIEGSTRRAAVAIVTAAVVLAAAGASAPAVAKRHDVVCTHGVSSIGPVFLRNGRIVGGDTTPYTQACLP